MSFLGKVRTYDTSPQETRGLRQDIAGGFQGQLPGLMGQAFGGTDNQFFLQNLLKPYQELFSAQRGSSLAQAKESAGNLTGSGYNNILGSSLAESLAGEQALLANIMNQTRTQQMGHSNDLLSLILGFSASGQPRQMAYQPGFVDYAAPVAGAAAGGYFGGR